MSDTEMSEAAIPVAATSDAGLDDATMSDTPLPASSTDKSIRWFLHKHRNLNQAMIARLKSRRNALQDAAEDASSPELESILSALQGRYALHRMLDKEAKEIKTRMELRGHGAYCEAVRLRVESSETELASLAQVEGEIEIGEDGAAKVQYWRVNMVPQENRGKNGRKTKEEKFKKQKAAIDTLMETVGDKPGGGEEMKDTAKPIKTNQGAEGMKTQDERTPLKRKRVEVGDVMDVDGIMEERPAKKSLTIRLHAERF